MNSVKYPIGRSITGYTKIKKSDFKLVKGNDGGLLMDTYKYKYIPIIIMDDDDEDEDDVLLPENLINESIKEIGEEEYRRLTTKMFQKWSTGNSKISIFMQNLDPHKVYNEEEFRELCKNSGINRLRQVMIYKNTIGHGNIIKEHNNNNYKLHTCLIKEFKNYF